jgi:hypothetical protein
MLRHQKNHVLTRSKSTELEPEASTNEQVKGSEVKETPHGKTSSATPKTVNASVASSYGDTSLSPASTLGTTASSRDSVPVTPVQVRFIKGKKKSCTSRCNKRDKMRRRKNRLRTS